MPKIETVINMVFENFSTRLRDLISKKGFIEPTLAQQLAVPELLKGTNVLVIAPTGLGKTESAMLPVLDKIASDREKHKAISAIYVTPTKSLNRDMLDRLCWWAEGLDLEISVRHGDTSQNERKMQRDFPPDVMITTPETLGALIVGQKMRDHLKNVRYVVVDEIHELVGSKRGAQLSLILERLEAITKNKIHRIGLSATIGEPEKVAAFLGNNVKIIRADSYKKYDIEVQLPATTEEDVKIADNIFVGTDTTSRIRKMLDLINKHKSVLVFTNTRETAEVLSSRLKSIDKGLKQEVHHGSLSKEIRIKGEKMFKAQELKALIATSSLELGIDIGSIDLVIQYLSPRQVSSLIQRVGRSGHRVGEISKGIILTGGEDSFESTAIAAFAIKKRLEEVRIHEMALDVLAHEMIGMAVEEYGVSAEKIFTTLSKANPFQRLTKKKFNELLLFLANLKLIYLNPIYNGNEIKDYTINRSRKGLQYYFENLSMIPDTRRKRIISIVEGEPVGFLDEPFIAEHGQQGNTFIAAGRAWRILEIEETRILVEPVDDVESAIPSWEGEMIPVPSEIAELVSDIREKIANMLEDKKKPDAIIESLMKDYPVDTETAKDMIDIVKQHIKTHTLPTKDVLLLEDYKDFIVLHAPFGTMVNDTLSRYIASEISLKTGISVNVKIDPYRIIFQTMLKPAQIIEIMKTANKVDETLQINLERSSIFKYRFIHVAKRFGIMTRDARLEDINLSKIIEQYNGTPAYDETLREVMTDKMDLKTTKQILEDVKKGKIKVIYEKGISYLGQLGLSQKFSDVMKPNIPKDEIFRAFKNRLMHTRVRLVCTNCADYSISKEVGEIDDKMSCPKCNSSMISVLSRYKTNPTEVLLLNKKKQQLTEAQEKELSDTKRSASLFITYGRKYALAQAGRGVGPETAARILAKLPDTEEKLLKLIYEAEKNYLRTKRFWD